MILILSLSLISLVVYLLYLNSKYWERRGVPGPKPKPIVGNMLDSFLMKSFPGVVYTEIYNKYSDCPMVGIFRGSTPCLLVRDPDLIKDVTVKDFQHFHDNEMIIDKNKDVIFGKNPFVLKGDEWKVVRGQLTPCFSSGKMKLIYPLLVDTGNRFVDYIRNSPESFSNSGREARDLCLRFTINNVASVAFGLEANCFEEKQSDFQKLATDFLSPGSWSMFKLFVLQMIPVLNRFISVKFTPDDVEKKLIDLVKDTLRYREENNIVRMDFLHIMNQLKQTCKEYPFTDLDVAAHAGGFIGDGFETSALTMSFALYALAANPNVQSKLRQELQDNLENGEISYEKLQSLPYLDAVMCESLRMHPTCTKEFTYVPKPGSVIKKPVHIEKGTSIILPVKGLQNDPKYHPEPDQFKPERFSVGNKENMTKYTYIPFGEGPRSCLGQRFGLLQIKVGLVKVIQNFEICVSDKTKVPFQYDPFYFMAWPIGGIWLKFKKIDR